MELTLHNQTEAPDEDNNAQLFEPGKEPLLEGEVIATRKKRKYMSQIEYGGFLGCCRAITFDMIQKESEDSPL
jgi:hypothetical protein